jgi:hypothetical protein
VILPNLFSEKVLNTQFTVYKNKKPVQIVVGICPVFYVA